MNEQTAKYLEFRNELVEKHHIGQLKRIKNNIEEQLANVDGLIKKTTIEVALEKGMAVKGINELLDLEYSYSSLDRGVDVMRKGSSAYYFNPSLDVWVKGTPEERKSDLYCRLTGEKISE